MVREKILRLQLSGIITLLRKFKFTTVSKLGLVSTLFILGTFTSVFVFKNYVGSENTIVNESQQIISMQKGDLISEVSITGQLKFSEVDSLKFLSSGKISSVFVDENDIVTKGTKLAQLEEIKMAELRKNVARSKSDVAAAQYSLKVSESQLKEVIEELDTTSTGDPNLIALKEKSISDAKINISKAEFNLSFYLDSGKQVDLDNAKSNYDVAQYTKSNASKSLDIISSQWETNIKTHEDKIIETKDDYINELNKWFGIGINEKYLISLDDLLKKWNTDLHTIFNESTILRDKYLLPLDNKSTDLDELTIYGWLHLSPETIGKEASSSDIWIDCKNTPNLPVKTIGTSSITKTCIEKSINDYWDNYKQSIKTLNEKNLEKQKL